MKKFELNETEIKGEIKKQVRLFIKNSILPEKSKEILIQELGDNWNDERFSPDLLVPSALQYSVSQWKEQNFKLYELWKEVVIKNSSINNTPHEVANCVIEEFIKQFGINNI